MNRDLRQWVTDLDARAELGRQREWEDAQACHTGEAEAAEIERGEALARREEDDDRAACHRLRPAVAYLEHAAMVLWQCRRLGPARQRALMALCRAATDYTAAMLLEEAEAARLEDEREAAL